MGGADLLSLGNQDSLVRTLLDSASKDGYIHLEDFPIDTFSIPEEYENVKLFRTTDVEEEIKEVSNNLAEDFSKKGFPSNLSTSLHEAILNAYQHAHKYIRHTPITVAHNISDDTLNVFVEDIGGVVKKQFLPYILAQRQHKKGEKALNFYEFSELDPINENLGVGTTFMHLYSDDVSYYKSPNNGLIVHMQKTREV
ncbi:ATP-binding protein [Candidatus Woesearchaeota archaeon]|nr:ATP-binding protein [Candidatus Woesearchaeota archaeon]